MLISPSFELVIGSQCAYTRQLMESIPIENYHDISLKASNRTRAVELSLPSHGE